MGENRQTRRYLFVCWGRGETGKALPIQARRGVKSPKTGVIGGCEAPDMGARIKPCPL